MTVVRVARNLASLIALGAVACAASGTVPVSKLVPHQPRRVVASPVAGAGSSPTPTPSVSTVQESGSTPSATPHTVAAPFPSPDSAGTSCDASWFAHPGYTAAHRTYVNGSRWRIHHNARSVVVAVVGTGPFIAGRCWDLSPDAFRELAPLGAGVIAVTWERA